MVLLPAHYCALADPNAHAAIAQHLAIQRADEASLEPLGYFDRRLSASQFDAAHTAAVQAAARKKSEQIGFRRALAERFDMKQRHDAGAMRIRKREEGILSGMRRYP
jgi:hypothetical protein